MTKIRVGFGPRTTANSFHQSGVKVAQELARDPDFECGIFEEPFNYQQLAAFDVLVFIKICPGYPLLKRLKDEGKKLILDYQDMFLYPTVYEQDQVRKFLKSVYYFNLERKEKARYRLFDRCFVSSPFAEDLVTRVGIEPFYLFRQIYNDWNHEHPKQHNDKRSGLVIYWTGVELNLEQNKTVEPVLRELCREYDCKVVYSTEPEVTKNDFIEYRVWSRDSWEREMLEADIAFRWWSPSNDQNHKDSNKIISYMAAGLPVVCRPTVSDRVVVEDGHTGFFADTPEEFREVMVRLIRDPGLRKRVGEAAHQEAWTKYSLERHAEEIKRCIREMIYG